MRKQIFAMAAIGLFTLTGCEDDNEPDPVNEEELITTVNLIFTDPAGAATTFTFYDIDAEGPQAPIITNDTLDANVAYTLAIEFVNETETPPEQITEEVHEEGDEHQIFFMPSQGLNLTVNYNDTDIDGRPIGLLNTANAGATSNGTLRVVLRHEPSKAAANVAAGDITNAGGETDIEVEFEVVIR